MRRHHCDTRLIFTDLDLVNKHSFGKRKQGIAFHHHLISLSTLSHTFLCSAVYHPFFFSLQPHQFPASPKSAKSLANSSSISLRIPWERQTGSCFPVWLITDETAARLPRSPHCHMLHRHRGENSLRTPIPDLSREKA
jgi:hypothetical protein